jgi:YbgC/YbaW family acyl-CoA thioester hydrolase
MIKASLVIAKSLIKKPSRGTPFRLRVMPWHLDLNFHVNNAVYLQWANQARLVYLAEKGYLQLMLKHRIGGVISKTEVTYLRSFKLGQIALIETEIKRDGARLEVLHSFRHNELLMAKVRAVIKLKGDQDLIESLLNDYLENSPGETGATKN